MAAYQPPALSPVRLGDILGALAGTIGGGSRRIGEDLADNVSRRFDAERVVPCGSGTQALELAVRVGCRALGAQFGSLALPAYSCFDLASAAIGAGVPVRFYDLDPATLAPDVEGVAAAIEAGALLIVVAPLYGYPVEWDSLRQLASNAGAILVEDAAQAAGALWRGRPVGSLGDLSVLSFGRGKGWTGGGGGALLARRGFETIVDAEVGDRAAVGGGGWRAAALTLAQWALGRPGWYGLPARIPWLGLGETVYHDPRPIAPISAFSAGLALATAEVADRARVGREETALALYREVESRVTPGAGVVPVRPIPGSDPGYLRLPVLVADRARVVGRGRRLGIAPGYPRVLPELSQLGDLARDKGDRFPGALRISRELVTLPTHRFVTEPLVDALLDTLENGGSG